MNYLAPPRLAARFSAVVVAGAVACMPVLAHAQLLPGQAIEVPAGRTTSVDVGVPVQVNYHADGWAVTSDGTTVNVTAPDAPGATAAVPASAGGRNATVTLIATGEAAPEAEAVPETGVPAGSAPAAGVETADAKVLRFDGHINANVITVKVSLGQAAELMKYAGADREGAKLRYLDVNGRFIEVVKREVDPAARTLTLTYPEGQTPDNPFIMEVVRDGTTAEFIAVITSVNAPVAAADAAAADSPYAQFGADSPAAAGEAVRPGGTEPESEAAPRLGPWIAGGVLFVAAIGLLARRRRVK